MLLGPVEKRFEERFSSTYLSANFATRVAFKLIVIQNRFPTAPFRLFVVLEAARDFLAAPNERRECCALHRSTLSRSLTFVVPGSP